MEDVLKRVISAITSIAVLCIVLCDIPERINASGIDNIIARAYYMYNATWIAKKNVNGWWDGTTYFYQNGDEWDGTFYKGNTYHIPYGQPVSNGAFIGEGSGFGASVEEYLSATSDENSLFYSERSYNPYNTPSYSTYYSLDCSGFVSYCWGISRTTTSSLPNLNVTNLGSTSDITNINNIQAGDVLNYAGHHMVLVTAVNDNDTIEIMQQTPPQIRVDTLTKQDIVNKYSLFTIFRYNNRDNVTPPETSDISSNIIIFDETIPSGVLELGANFGIYGNISSNRTLQLVWGGIYESDGVTKVQFVEASPKARSYNLHGMFNNNLIFDNLSVGKYTYIIYAKDDKKEYKLIESSFQIGYATLDVTLNTNGGDTSNDLISVVGNTYPVLPTPTRKGYDFIGWYTSLEDGIEVRSGSSIVSNSNHTLFAHWKPKTLTVTFDTNGGSCSELSGLVTYDQIYGELPDANRIGYVFQGWYTASSGGTLITSTSIVNLTTDHTLFAHWSISTTILYFDSVGGTSDFDQKNIVYGEPYGTFPCVSRKGYTFEGWYLDEEYTIPITEDSIVKATGNQTAYAKWSIRQFIITFDAGEGIPDVETKRVVFGKAYGALPEATMGEEVFRGWFTADGVEITSESIVELEEDIILYARWRVQGDVNADGVFDTQDVIMVQDWLLAKPDATLTDWRAADACQDERIDVFDLCLLKRWLIERNGDIQ